MTKIVIACDSFKECMTSLTACKTIEKGLLRANADFKTTIVPISDGGDGLNEVVKYFLKGEIINLEVCGPLSKKVNASYYLIDNELAIIESSKACGLDLVPLALRNPLYTTTYGLGEMVIDALKHGVKKIDVGLGGSSTNDAGMGFLRALGAKYYDQDCHELITVMDLLKLDHVDLTEVYKILEGIEFTVLSDVDNYLLGSEGATYTFSKQKGADIESQKILEACLTNWAKVIKSQMKRDVDKFEGAGAAGGLGSAFVLLGAKFERGINKVLDLVKFDELIKDADYIITGEGSVDFQTVRGKVIHGIVKRAQSYAVPVIAITGNIKLDLNEIEESGLCSVFSIVDRPKTLNESIVEASMAIEKLSYNIGKLIK